MATELQEPGNKQDDDWKPGSSSIPGIDLDRTAGDDDLPENHPSRSDSKAASPEQMQAGEAAADPGASDDGAGDTEKGGLWQGGNKSDDSSIRKRIVAKVPGRGLKKRILIGGAILGSTAAIGGFIGFFGFMNQFKLDFFLSGVEKRAFGRFQVDMDGRSSKWLEAYMALRMGEVDEPSVKPEDRENLLFRSNRVDRNNPAYDWFRTMRASSFEKDVFESSGIKFTSVAQKQADGSIRFRPGKVTVGVNDDTPLTFMPTEAEMEAIQNGDVDKFNGRLQDFIEVEVFGSDKEGRKAIKKVVNERLKPWQVFKKRHLRKDIQNMTGIRDWRFFETTRDRFAERKISVRNKVIVKALPESTKSGKFVQCMFGIISCRSSSDIANPENRAKTPTPNGQRQGETNGVDEDGNPIQVDDGKASQPVEEGLKDALSEEDLGTSSLQKKFITQIISKFSSVVGLASILDSLSRIDKSIRDGSLSSMVTVARGTQAAGFFTTLAIARDQMKTGEVTPDEVNEFMSSTGNNLGRSEAWSNISGSDTSGTVSAAPIESVKRDEYCSEEHQAKLTEDEYHMLCDAQTIGGKNNAEKLEDWWVNGPIGKVVGPILSAYRHSVGIFVGPLLSIAGEAVSAVITPVLKPILAATGLQATIQDASGFLLAQVSEGLGAGPMADTETPQGVIGNIAYQGGAYTAESSTRYQGAAATTRLTRAEATERTLAYYNEENRDLGFSQRYLSLSNPDSAAGKQLFAASNSDSFKNPVSAMASIFKSFGSIPGMVFATPAHADDANDPYRAANFAKIDTFDFPNTCINGRVLNMTPQSATNADDLGIIPADELSWELLGSKEAFYDRLYRDNPNEDKALQVYNCGLLDTSVRGTLGARYGYTKDNAIAGTPAEKEEPTDTTTPESGALVSGDSKELAKKIIASPKVTIAAKYLSQIQGVADGSDACHVNPTILQLIATIAEKHSIYITSINRFCTNTLTASGTASYHYREKGGHAVDIGGIDGQTATGSTAKELTLLKEILPSLPKGSGIGQSNCRAAAGKSISMPAGISQFSDSCNHLHIQVPVQ